MPIDAIYAELVLLCENKQEEKNKKEKQARGLIPQANWAERGNPRSKQTTSNEKLFAENDRSGKAAFEEHRINSWEDIRASKEPIVLNTLFENRRGKIPKKLLILGRAGIGKSTLCQYIAHQWAEGKLWKEKFEAVFWIPLRKLQNVHSAETVASTLFRLCCPMKGVFTKDVANYLQKNPSRILLILDGLDEISLAEDGPQKRILDQLLKFPYWIVTSRPHAAGGLCADDIIENVGYASKTIDLYIQKSFKNQAAAVIQKLRQNPILFGFCHIPINLELICTILNKSKGDLSNINSMTSLYEQLTLTLQKRFLDKIGRPDVWNWTSKQCGQDEEIKKALAVFELLEALAWMGMQSRQLIFSLNSKRVEKIIEKFPDVSLIHVCISGFLQSTQDNDDMLENEHSFLHLTFQEFFAARYLVNLLASAPTVAAQLIRGIKFDPRYKVVMWFIAGLLRNGGDKECPQCLNAFFEALDTPKDSIGFYGSILKMRCLEECNWQEDLQKIKAYEDEIKVWVGRMKTWDSPIEKCLLETFEISPQGAKLLLIPKLFSSLARVDLKEKVLIINILGQVGHADHKMVIPWLLQGLKDKSDMSRMSGQLQLKLLVK